MNPELRNCPRCSDDGRGEVELVVRNLFGRPHHYHCIEVGCGWTEPIVATRATPQDRERFHLDDPLTDNEE